MKYCKIRTFRTSEIQHDTLKKMRSYNIDVSKFIREAIAEKIKRDYKDMIPKITTSTPLDNILRELNKINKNN